MLDKLDILRNLNLITNSVVFTYPKTAFVSENRDMFATFDFSDIKEFPTFGIKDNFRNFLQLLSFYSNYSKNSDIIMLKDKIKVFNKNQETEFLTQDLDLLKDFAVPQDFIENTVQKGELKAQFTLKEQDLKDIRFQANVLELGCLQFTPFKAKVLEIGKFDPKDQSFTLKLEGMFENNVCALLGIENFQKLPLQDYEVQIYANPNTQDDFRVLFLNSDLKIKILCLCLEK